MQPRSGPLRNGAERETVLCWTDGNHENGDTRPKCFRVRVEGRVLPSRNLLLQDLGFELSLIADHLIPTTLRAGQVLNEPGEEIRQVYFPTGGLVSAFGVFETGQQIECVLFGRNGAIGAMAAIGFPISLTRDVCHFDSHAWSISASFLRDAVEKSPGLRDLVTRSCERVMSYAVRVGACNALHTVEQRLARWLLNATDLLEQPEVCLPQEAFGQILGAQRTSINPLLQKFQREQLISIGRARLTVIDQVGLLRRTCECHAALHSAVSGKASAEPAQRSLAPLKS